MRNILALVGLVVVLFCGGGWVLDWYKIVSFTAENGRYLVAVEINHQKMGDDWQQAQAWISRTVSTARDKGTSPPTSPTNTPANTPGSNANAPPTPVSTTTPTPQQTPPTGGPSGGLSSMAQGAVSGS